MDWEVIFTPFCPSLGKWLPPLPQATAFVEEALLFTAGFSGTK
jgi:hypothetical protein